MLVCGIYVVTRAVQVVDSIVVVSVVTCSALLHYLFDLKAAQINVQCGELMLYKFKLGHNVTDATKNMDSVKGKGTFDHCIVTRWLKKFYLGCKCLDHQA